MVIDALEEQFWFRTNQYQYQERIALAEAIANQEVQVNQLPEAVLSPLTEVARERWDAEAEKGEVAAADARRAQGVPVGSRPY